MIAHHHALDQIAVAKAIQEFFRAVQLGFVGFLNGHRICHGDFTDFCPQRRGKIGHFIDLRAALQPFGDLLCAKFALAQILGYEAQKLLRVQGEQFDLIRHARISFLRRRAIKKPSR